MSAIISVVIPIYNVEPYLRQCLDSVVNQTYRNLEIILIDDGSPDNCGAICDEYAARDERVIVVHKENGGLSAARNDGIARATGEWIAFVDSDDWCEPDYYEKLLQYAGEEKADVICANGCFIEVDNSARTTCHEYTKAFLYKRHEDMETLMVKVLMPGYATDVFCSESGMGAPWDKLFRVSFLRRTGLVFDTSSKAWEDLWFVFQAFDKAGAVAGADFTGYHYRMVNTSITKNYNPQKPQINYDFLAKLHLYLGERAKEPLMRAALEVRAMILIHNSVGCCLFNPNSHGTLGKRVKELHEMIQWPFFYDAICSEDDQYLSLNARVWKHGLRRKSGGYLLLLAYKAKKLLR